VATWFLSLIDEFLRRLVHRRRVARHAVVDRDRRWSNGRYFFSTGRWGRAVALLLFIGWLIKLVLVATR
jgi:hypothetical protein